MMYLIDYSWRHHLSCRRNVYGKWNCRRCWSCAGE